MLRLRHTEQSQHIYWLLIVCEGTVILTVGLLSQNTPERILVNPKEVPGGFGLQSHIHIMSHLLFMQEAESHLMLQNMWTILIDVFLLELFLNGNLQVDESPLPIFLFFF